jgi:prefoldin subunit 5
MVELGTGYFCEKEVPAAVELIDRKVGVAESCLYVLMNLFRSLESVNWKIY